ncbi:TetR family transcriptional regulator ActII [Actinocorallia aurea]
MPESPIESQMPDAPWRRPRKKPRQSLDLNLIVDVGIRILGGEGLDAVSMRKVAQELGTGPASLYAHVSGKEELLELMLDRVVGLVRLPAEPEPERWKEQVAEVVRDCMRVYAEHRDIALVSLGNIPGGPNQLRVAEFLLDLLVRAGVPPQIAAWSVDRLALMLDADAVESAVFARRQESGVGTEEYLTGVKDYLSRLPAAAFPRLTSLREEIAAGTGAERLEFGLDLLLRGIESHIERPRGAKAPRPASTS